MVQVRLIIDETLTAANHEEDKKQVDGEEDKTSDCQGDPDAGD